MSSGRQTKRKSARSNPAASAGNRGMPMPRLPQRLGSTQHLGPRNTVYPAKVELDVPFTPFSLAIAAGALAQNTNLDIALVSTFSARFASLFREYCVVGARVEVRLTAATTLPQGVLKMWIDEDSNGAPTLAQAVNRATLDIALVSSPADKVYTIDWKPQDYLDLDWTDTGTTVTSAFLKSFSSTGTGAAGTTAAQLIVTGTLAFAFRGYQ